MKIFFSSILFSLLCLIPSAGAKEANPASLFQQANAAYRGGDYGQAASLYESLIAQDQKEGDIYYNLGNAYFKQGKMGLALLQYERARKLDPRDHDFLANLNYVRSLLEYRVEDKRNWYLRAFEAVLAFFTEKEMGIASLAFGVLFWMSWIFSLYVRPGSLWGWKRKMVSVLAALAFSFWVAKGLHDRTTQEAIVMKPQAPVRYGPSYKDQVALKLGEGIKIRVTKNAGEWSRIVLTNGETGWIAQEEIGII